MTLNAIIANFQTFKPVSYTHLDVYKRQVDTNKAHVEQLTESYDVLGIVGNGSSITTLAEAGIEDADVFIAVTGSDAVSYTHLLPDSLPAPP